MKEHPYLTHYIELVALIYVCLTFFYVCILSSNPCHPSLPHPQNVYIFFIMASLCVFFHLGCVYFSKGYDMFCFAVYYIQSACIERRTGYIFLLPFHIVCPGVRLHKSPLFHHWFLWQRDFFSLYISALWS